MTQFNRYEIKELIGAGGFAKVYAAEDTRLGRSVAIKILDPLLAREAEFVARFEREARALAQLDHPHIMPIFDYGQEDGRYFLAMKLISDGNLGDRLQDGPLSWDETVQLLEPICQALDYAHQQDVVHRDLKPANIMLDSRSGVLVADFGFARLITETSHTLATRSGSIVGTPAYIPIEVWDGEKATAAADIYALGCILFEMVTGHKLFDGDTPVTTMRQHDKGAQLPNEWPADVPTTVAEVIQRATAADPAARHPDAQSLLEEVKQLSLDSPEKGSARATAVSPDEVAHAGQPPVAKESATQSPEAAPADDPPADPVRQPKAEPNDREAWPVNTAAYALGTIVNIALALLVVVFVFGFADTVIDNPNNSTLLWVGFIAQLPIVILVGLDFLLPQQKQGRLVAATINLVLLAGGAVVALWLLSIAPWPIDTVHETTANLILLYLLPALVITTLIVQVWNFLANYRLLS